MRALHDANVLIAALDADRAATAKSHPIGR
jgi:hypothetical protein